MIILAIDPGLEGALALLGDEGRCGIYDLPVKWDEEHGKRIDAIAFAELVQRIVPPGAKVQVCIEGLAAGGQDKGRNQFKTVGSQFWTQSALVNTLELLGLRVDAVVLPQTWKPFFGLKGKAAADKALTMRKARELVADLYPDLADHVQLQKHHNRAEAVLIGHWYRKVKA